MKRHSSPKKAPRILLAIALLLLAGIGGYVAMGLINSQPQASDSTISQGDTAPPAPDPQVCIASLPAITKIHQKIMVAAFSDHIHELIPALSDTRIGGVIIMDEVSKEQIEQMKAAPKIAPLIAVDQEGGTVQRYKSQGLLVSASDIAKLPSDQAYQAYLSDSQYLASLGITTNFAPVVDVESKPVSPLPGRIYSSDPNTVATYAGQAIRAMQASGLQPVIKHFPGLGSASGNTDFVAATTDPYSTLKERDLVPYHTLQELSPDVMVGNMIVPGLTGDQPAIWSPAVYALLRSSGYKDAVVYTDSLTAEAIPGSLEAAALKAWIAGADLTVIVQDKERTVDLASYITLITDTATMSLQSGELTEDQLNQSVARILARKHSNPCDISQ